MRKITALVLISIVCTILPTMAFANETKLFPDVKSTHWAIDAINYGTENKIISGYPDGTFRPNESVTEAEFLSMLLKAFGNIPQYTEDELDYTSLKKLSDWSKPVYAYACSFRYCDILTKNNIGEILPNTIASRLWVAELLTATQGVHLTGDFAIKYVMGNGFASGYSEIPNVEEYKPLGTLTRAEAIQLIKNLIDSGVSRLEERPIDTSSLRILDHLPISVSGKTMFEKIQDIITDDRYSVDITLSGDYIAIVDTTKEVRKYEDRIIYESILRYDDRRRSSGSVGSVQAFWKGEPTNETYEYLKKILELLSIPKADEVVKEIKSQYDEGKFNVHGQLSYERIVGDFNLYILISSSGSHGFYVIISNK